MKARLQLQNDCEHKRTLEQPGDETFYPRKGCLDCNRWLEPVKLRKP